MSKKILNHPDSNELIRRLSEGESIRTTMSWLQAKYPKNKKMWLSNPTLQKFRKENLNLKGKVLKDIQESSVVQKRQINEQQKQAKLQSTNAYQDKINEIADTHLDVSRKILQLDAIIGQRMEYWYNAIYEGEATPHQADKEIRNYMDRQMALLQQYKKLVEGMADHTVEHNVNVTVMNDQVTLIRDTIREVLSLLEPTMALKFVDSLNNKLEKLNYASPLLSDGVDDNALNAIEAEVLDPTDV